MHYIWIISLEPEKTATTGAVTHVCSQMAYFEQELKRVKVYHITHCSSYLLLLSLSTSFKGPNVCQINTNTPRRDQEMEHNTCFHSRPLICHGAISPHHTKTSPDELGERKLNSTLLWVRCWTLCIKKLGWWPSQNWTRAREAFRETAVIHWCLITLVFLSGVIRQPGAQCRSKTVSHHNEEQEPSETVAKEDVSLPCRSPELVLKCGAPLAAASCSYQTQWCSACVREFTPGPGGAITLTGSRDRRHEHISSCAHEANRRGGEGGSE